MVGYERIRVTAPYRIKKIEDVRLNWKPNEHAWLHLRGIVDDSEQVNAVLQAASEDEIHLYESDGETEATIFKGLVTSVQITNTQGVYTIELEGLSGSFQLDIKRKRRSFQQVDMTYPKLVQEVIKSYPGHNMINSIGEGVKIGEAIIQYDETDWELLKRLASHFQGVLVSDIMEATPRFSFGLTYGKSYTLPDDVSYTASKDLLAYQKAGGDAAGLHDTDFFTYEIESGERYAIGDEIQFRNKRMVVSAVSARMQQGLFRYTYRLSRLDGIRQEKIHNSKLSGVSLEGKVLEVKGEQVKLHLDIDKEQSKATACWVPFAPPTGNMMYCMPQVGTQASLYFPDATGKQAMVLGSVRKNGDSCAKTGNPNIRYFGTEHGSELELSPTAINIVSGNKEPLKLTIDDKVGITMTSHKKLVLNAKEEISLYTPKRIVIHAQSQFFAKKTSAKSGFTIESEYHFLGTVVQAEGRDRTTFPPYNDEPQKGTPPAPDPPFNWGKLLVGVVAAVAIVGFVALSVATFGAGAVIGAAAVGAALGAIGGVVTTASSDIANGKMSSAYDYLKSATQGAVIGAICGAIFGPATGIGGGAVIPMTGGQTALSLGSGMFIGGSSGYIDYTIRELWDGRTPDAGKALESFAVGAMFGGAFTLGASWLSQGLSKIKGMGKGGAAPKGEGTGNGGSRASGTQTEHAEKILDTPDKKTSPKVVNGDSGHSNHATPPKGKPDTTKKDDLQGKNKPDVEGTGEVPKPRSGKDLLSNIEKVVYGESDLSKIAIDFRKANKMTSPQRNIAVFEYLDENGNLVRKAFASNSDDHSEIVGMKFLKENNIRNEAVKRIYSEREPCILTETNRGNCAEEIKNGFPNVKVEYSIDYGETKELGKRAKEEMKELLEQYVGNIDQLTKKRKK